MRATESRSLAVRRVSPSGRPLRSLPETAKELGVSVEAVRTWAKTGDLPTVRLGSRFYVLAAELDKLLTPQSGA